MAAGPAARSAVFFRRHHIAADATFARDCSGRGGGLGRSPERIGLPDQPREFGKRIALAPPSLVDRRDHSRRRERSVLISISHRDDASPSGQRQPAMSNKP